MGIRVKCYGLVILCLLSLTGCWDNRDITEIDFVTAVGIDRTPDGKFEVIVEIPKPGLLRSAKSGGGGDEKAVAVYSSTGDTVFEAIRNSLKTVNRKLVWTQLGLMVIGEEVAKEGITEIMDFFERDPEPSVTALVLMAKDTSVEAIMNLESDMEDIPSLHLINVIETNQKALGTTCPRRVIDVLKVLSCPGKEPTIPLISLTPTGQEPRVQDIQIEGLAVFRGEKTVGFLNAEESRGCLLIQDKGQSSVLTIPSPFDPEKMLGFEMDRSKSKKEMVRQGDQYRLKVTLDVKGDIGELGGKGDFLQAEVIAQLQAEVSKAIQREAEAAIERAQFYQSDIFGFGEMIHRHHLAEWKEVHNQWNHIFCQSEIEVKVEVKIERSGYIKNPVQPA